MTAISQTFPVSILYFIVIALGALWSALFLQGKFAPTLRISNNAEWMSGGIVRITVSIENVGFVRCNIEKIISKVSAPDAEHNDKSPVPSILLTEWIELGDAEQIFTSTTHLNPREMISCDRIYSVGTSKLLHIGTQIIIKNPWYIHVLGPKARTTRQTSVVYTCSPAMTKKTTGGWWKFI